MKKAIALAVAMFAAAVAQAEIPLYPTIGVYSPARGWDKTAAWTLPRRPRGYLVIISASMRFDPTISDYVTCTMPGMVGAAGDETTRFSVSFSETKTITLTGFVPGTSVQVQCLSEGQKARPVNLTASMVGVSVDQALRR